MSIELLMLSNHLILCRPLLFLPSIFPRIKVFSSESALHIKCPKYWSFSFSIGPSSEYSGSISFRMDWFNLLDCSQESSPAPQFKASIIWLLYGPTLTSKQVPEALDQTWILDFKTTFTCIPTTLLTADPQGPGGHQAKGRCISLPFEGMNEWRAQRQSLGIQC